PSFAWWSTPPRRSGIEAHPNCAGPHVFETAAARPPQGEGSAQIPPQPEEGAKHPSRRRGGPARCILPVLAPVTQRYVLHILLLWLAGNALRLPILAVPPVIPAIHHDLNLSATGVGILGGLPVVVFAVAAVPGALLIARLGPVRALVVGLVVAAIGGALRGAVASVAWLYAMTIVMAAGVAVMQPAMPALVRLWTPQRAAFATAVYSNGLLVGETLPVLFMIPLV